MPTHVDTYKCPKCTKNVTKTQKRVGCAYCGEYFHIECAKITVEQYDFLCKNKILKYICNNCSSLPKFCNVQEELRNGFAALTSSLEKELEKKLEESKRLLNEQLELGLKAIEEKYAPFVNDQPLVNASDVELIKSEVKQCFDVIKVVDNAANQKLEKLQTQNNILQRRLNRANIVIWGLAKKILDLRTPILKICSLCNVPTTNADIQHCTYFAGGKAVLVKFNSVQIRDAIMINYNNNRNLKLCDVIPCDIQSNVILNDHLTDVARKLIAVCRNLKNNNKIAKYRFWNYDVPKVSIVMNDGSSKMCSYDDCVQLLEEDCPFSPNTSIM